MPLSPALTDAAIIGGTGIGEALAKLKGYAIHIPTSVGQLVGKLVERESGPVLLVSRHSAGHKSPPHMVNYRAIALGLKKAGVKYCFSTAAVGSLKKEWGKGTLIAISDFADLTGRRPTLFDDCVIHTDFSEPFSQKCNEAFIQAGESKNLEVQPRGIYVCENGPRYETPHEIKLLAGVGDVVGMTAATEAILMREAGIAYGCLAEVTNMAAGLEDRPLDHREVVQEMTQGSDKTVALLLYAVDLMRKTQ